MTIEERRARDRTARRQLIVTTARRIAEAEGWDAVTTRRLSPKSSTASRSSTSTFRTWKRSPRASPVEGFQELAESLSDARGGAAEPEHALRRIAHAYIDFALANPAVYDAMFTRATTLHFAGSDSPPELWRLRRFRDAVTAVEIPRTLTRPPKSCGPRCTAWPRFAEAGTSPRIRIRTCPPPGQPFRRRPAAGVKQVTTAARSVTFGGGAGVLRA